jgi:hypothetical protein
MSVVARRLARLARKRSVAAVGGALRRELGLLRDEASVERALRSDARLIVGPFIGEVGYELLYWRPRVLHVLRTHRVDPARVVVVTRGGAGAWYAPYAGAAVDVLDLIAPEELRRHVDERAVRTGQRKQVAEDDLDRRLVALVRERVGPAVVIHPRLMYGRLRFLWDGTRPPEDATALGDYDDLPRVSLPKDVESRLPARFVAAKVYANEALGAGPVARDAIRRRFTDDLPVVRLDPGVALDDHAGLEIEGIEVSDLLEPRTNLAVQAEIVARAERLVATYGGFSYIGPFHRVPTIALATRSEANPHHERVLRAVRPGARFERVQL